MADIFISYKSERKLAAEHFAEVLRRYGYSVWFDYSLIKGKDFAEQIERQIRASKSLVVLWCSMSFGSRWVREEVHLAQDLGLLIPVKIEPCENPFGFRLADSIDLSGWDGSPRSHQLDPLLDDLDAKVGRPAMPDRQSLIEYERTWRRFGAQPLRAFALGEPIEPDNGGLPFVASGTADEARRAEEERERDEAERKGREQEERERQEAEAWARREKEEANRPKPVPREEAPTGEPGTTGTGGGRGAKPPGWIWGAGAGAIALVIAVWVFYPGPKPEPGDGTPTTEATGSEAGREPAPAPEQRTAEPADEAKQGEAGASEAVEVELATGQTKRIVPGSGESFKDCAECPEMVLVPSGSFLMGSNKDEESHHGIESPQHKVKIPGIIAVSKYEVTHSQFNYFLLNSSHDMAGGCYVWDGQVLDLRNNIDWDNIGWPQTGKHPVACINWHDARSYIGWLSKKTGKNYRLLSESE